MSAGPPFPQEPGDRLERVRARIRAAALRVDRDPREVTLIAVSKTVDEERILAMARAGQRVFGENRVQEALAKVPRVEAAWEGEPLRWRMIGHLQRNKVRAALDWCHHLDGVDSVRLLEAVSREGERRGIQVPILLQFNCSGEASKSGFDPAEAGVVARAVREAAGVVAEGLMTIGPLSPDPETARPAFRRLREIRRQLADDLGRELPELSMGMSGDLEVGVEEGATLVRVGTALFGERG